MKQNWWLRKTLFGIVIIIMTVHIGTEPHVVNGQITFVDRYRPAYRFLRNSLFDMIGRTDGQWAYDWNHKRSRTQKPYPMEQQFFCDPLGPGGRSPIVPVSVHQLRPGDIDVIGAIGDSLTAGNGALATNVLQVLIENKGVSWSIGGQGTWHRFLTLPNILKVFNPQLYGFSLSDGFSTDKSSRFNTAEIGAMSRDIHNEAKVLVKRMKSDPNVNMAKHWKLITILIGPNDFCLDVCYMPKPEQSVARHERDLIQTLRTLYANLPRTMVNLVTPPSMDILVNMQGKPMECQSIHHVECPCMFSVMQQHKRPRYYAIMERWKKVVEKVAAMKEFHGRVDFTVTNQPFLKNVTFPRLTNGNHDFTYMSLDCFHLSQKGYARAANALWNNMLEPVGRKSTNWYREFSEIKCPTAQMPFIYTNENS